MKNKIFSIIVIIIIIIIIVILLFNQNKEQRERVVLTATMRRIHSYLMAYQSENASFFPPDKIFNDFIREGNLPVSNDDFVYKGSGVKYMIEGDAQQLLYIKPSRYKYYYIIMFTDGMTTLKKETAIHGK